MVRITPSIVLFSSVLSFVTAAPLLEKRIAQVIADSTADWEKACITAGGGEQCNPISQQAFSSLLAAGKNCDQQDAADKMVDLAKQLNNDAEMIRLAQLFVQQPRNAPDSLQVAYCQVAPKNQELNGLFHCQFAGSNFDKFSGDQTGNLPLGVDAVNPPGSCRAKPDGPVPDGVQLNTLAQNPQAAGAAKPAETKKGKGKGKGKKAAPDAANETAVQQPETEVTEPAAAAVAAATPAAGDFRLENGKEAKALNAQFATLDDSSACKDGENACVDAGFAQCVGGKFQVTQCGSGLICAALPLVNKPGTSITCTTQADVDARIKATGA